MRPVLGWAGLSRSALKRAEAQLVADSAGVRDEVGVLSLHTAYANRFFPGTSVQQTRLRYALFVPWQITTLLRDRERGQSGQARRVLEQAELNLARRLPGVDGEGTNRRAGWLKLRSSEAVADVIGARAIVVQALDEEAKAFYGRFGFRPFSDGEPFMLVLRTFEPKAVFRG